jgi:hypothetical protein
MATVEDSPKVVDASVRLVCRYSNGIMESAVARGMEMKGGVLRVICRTNYEVGVQVTVMAGFLPRTTPGQVIVVKRGEEPGTWVVDLRLRALAMPVITATVQVESERAPVVAMREAAGTLAKRLDSAGWIPFFQAAFAHAAASERPAMLAATEMAVFSLLEERGFASMGPMLNRIGKGPK